MLSNEISKRFEGMDQGGTFGVPTQTYDPISKSWELSSDDVIEMVEHILRGHKKKYATGGWDTAHEQEVLKKIPVRTVVTTDESGKEVKTVEFKTIRIPPFRIMNDIGIFRTIAAMQMILNKNTYLSNFDETESNTNMRYFAIAYAELLKDKAEEFELDLQYLDYVHELVVQPVIYAIQRQSMGGERAARAQNVQETRLIRQDIPLAPQPEKKGGLLGIGKWGF